MQRHIEPQIRLVGTVTPHRLGIGHPWERRRQLHAARILEDGHDHPLHEGHDLLTIHERHFQIDLGEFRLAVVA